MSEVKALVPTNGNGNGHGTLPALPAPVEAPYKPKRIDWLYLQAVEEIMASDGRLTNEAIGKRLPGKPDPETGAPRPMTREGVRYLGKRPGFMDWLGAQLRAGTDREWPAVLRRATTLALRGSIDHMEFLAKVRGEFAQASDGGGPAGMTFNGPTVNLLIPRAEWPGPVEK